MCDGKHGRHWFYRALRIANRHARISFPTFGHYVWSLWSQICYHEACHEACSQRQSSTQGRESPGADSVGMVDQILSVIRRGFIGKRQEYNLFGKGLKLRVFVHQGGVMQFGHRCNQGISQRETM